MTAIQVRFRAFRAAALGAALLVAPSLAHAIPVPIAISGAGTLGSFEGSFAYDADTDSVLVSLTNTSPIANGGFITAFAFNLPDDVFGGAVLSLTTDPEFQLLFGVDSVDAPPLGSFDIGATTDPGDPPPTPRDPSWLGGGNPDRGIGVGATASFAFALTLIGPEPTTDQILSVLSIPTGSGLDRYPFAVRFRGFTVPPGADDSDKVVGGAAVPEPGSLLLLASGAAALLARRRRAS